MDHADVIDNTHAAVKWIQNFPRKPTMDRSRWLALLAWLQSHHGMNTNDILVEPRATAGGYGLFALRTCPPSSPLFAVPQSAMMNIKTLSPHYPSGLTAVQLISLHLMLNRPEQDQDSLDPLFGPYISILPRNFDFHPLMQLVKKANHSQELLDQLTPSSAQALEKLAARFSADFDAICRYLRNHPKIIQSSSRLEPRLGEIDSLRLEYVWSWLNVNTRCIFLQLKKARSDPDNLTLCPILDFANHTCQRPQIDVEPNKEKHENGAVFSVLSPRNMSVSADEEIFLTYGAHCNRNLFVEYGFVLHPLSESWDNCVVEVEVDDIVEELFRQKGSVGTWMMEILRTENYWRWVRISDDGHTLTSIARDWTIHSNSESIYPSFRLVTCLRLYNLLPCGSVPANGEESLQSWRRTVIGTQHEISTENEFAWKETLRKICCSIIHRAETWMKHSEQVGSDVMTLWKEELYVARYILKRIRNGEELL
ncbi:hypothetical protein D9758_003298 [Tetrapyrgos nigripes]|uniref:SET domain-containing protein n=1 Tax=Tetrapyrgos nigripes TaxID=182062 RepID=A0A8H5GIM3_9AGAR|nr:hypothetical protein D9758_003298 [Tetrapyrgos nigripes]